MGENNLNKSSVEEGGELRFTSGLTWRSMLALFYSLFVFSPAVIWLNLVTVSATGISAIEAGYIPTAIITLLIFSEVSSIFGKPLTKQEATIIYGPATAAGSAGFLTLIYRAFYVRSPLLSEFKLDPSLIPTWWAPPPSSPVWSLRTFNHLDWIVPIELNIITWFLSMGGGLFFGLLGRELFVEGERLPFPMQHITAATIDALAERREDRMTIFAWAALISFIYGIALYTVPTISSVLGLGIRFIPIPWYDFTPQIELFMPGGSFGVATDVIVLSSGIVVPAPIVIGIFIGSFARFFVGNWMLVNYGISDWAKRWVPGMSFTKIYQDSNLYFWLNPLIGIGFAVGLVPLIFRWKIFARSIKAAFKLRTGREELEKRISGPPFPAVGMVILFLSLLGAVALDLYLVPGFPAWSLILYEIVFPFITMLAVGRMIAIAGTGVSPPYITKLTILMSGYQNVDAWYLPLSLNPGTGWLGSLKIAQLTGTSAMSWVKAHIIAHPLALIAGYLYMSLFWQIAPIPSDIYPAPGIQWPINLMNEIVWVTRTEERFQPISIASWFAGFGAIMVAFEFLRRPFSMIGVAAGLGVPIPVATTMLIGLIIKLALAKIMGERWIRQYQATLAAGLGLGESIAIVIGVALALAEKSIWPGSF